MDMAQVSLSMDDRNALICRVSEIPCAPVIGISWARVAPGMTVHVHGGAFVFDERLNGDVDRPVRSHCMAALGAHNL